MLKMLFRRFSLLIRGTIGSLNNLYRIFVFTKDGLKVRIGFKEHILPKFLAHLGFYIFQQQKLSNCRPDPSNPFRVKSLEDNHVIVDFEFNN